MQSRFASSPEKLDLRHMSSDTEHPSKL
jgi:hypothetical protein